LPEFWEHALVQWVGDGSELWRVRVDLFAPDHDAGRVPVTDEALGRQLTETDGVARKPGDWVADQGLGREGERPGIGFVFWGIRRRDRIGGHARGQRRSPGGSGKRVGTEWYDVSIFPHAAIADRYGDPYPQQPD
jgi:hypothetical protein